MGTGTVVRTQLNLSNWEMVKQFCKYGGKKSHNWEKFLSGNERTCQLRKVLRGKVSLRKTAINTYRDYMRRNKIKMGKEENKFSMHILRFKYHAKTLRWKYLAFKLNMKKLLSILCCGYTELWDYSSQGRLSHHLENILRLSLLFLFWRFYYYFLLVEI